MIITRAILVSLSEARSCRFMSFEPQRLVAVPFVEWDQEGAPRLRRMQAEGADMRVRFWIPSVAVASLLVACATTPKPIPVSGSAADVSQLDGEWSGEYHGAGGGRSGLISFKLSAGADSASGDVLMFPRQRNDPPPTATTTDQRGTPNPNPPQG